MQNCNQICILGNDKRMDFIAQFFFDKGYEISRDIEDIKEYSIVVVEPNSSIDIDRLLKCLENDAKLFLPKKTLLLEKKCAKRGIRLFDYLCNDDIIRENARLTAYGIVREAKLHGAVIEQSNCLVSGYGFCSKEIIKELQSNKANVDVFVRRKDLRETIEEGGCACLLMSDIDNLSFDKYSYVFNTVPAIIFTKKILDKLPGNVIIFDIASLPGGVCREDCTKKNIKVIHSLGIPGKMYPKEAGLLIAKEIFNMIQNASNPICE